MSPTVVVGQKSTTDSLVAVSSRRQPISSGIAFFPRAIICLVWGGSCLLQATLRRGVPHVGKTQRAVALRISRLRLVEGMRTRTRIPQS
jgi:hypothetical protein